VITPDETPAETETGGRLRVGDAAPAVLVTLASGEQRRLADLWRDGPLALAFLRHFG
jgi:hypothetical protein